MYVGSCHVHCIRGPLVKPYSYSNRPADAPEVSLTQPLSSTHSFMNKDSITIHAFSPIVQCQDQPSESDAFLLSRGRSVLHAGCHTIGWQTPNARELEDCVYHSAFHRVQLTKIYAQLFSTMLSSICPHLHWSRLQVPS